MGTHSLLGNTGIAPVGNAAVNIQMEESGQQTTSKGKTPTPAHQWRYEQFPGGSGITNGLFIDNTANSFLPNGVSGNI